VLFFYSVICCVLVFLIFSDTDSKGQATFESQIQLIVEWGSDEDNEKLYANDDFKNKALPHFNNALESKDFVFTKCAFN
jgi:hypothetical protein